MKCAYCNNEPPSDPAKFMGWNLAQQHTRDMDEFLFGVSFECKVCHGRLDPEEVIIEYEM